MQTHINHITLSNTNVSDLLFSHVSTHIRIREQLSYVNHALYLLRTGYAKKPKAPV